MSRKPPIGRSVGSLLPQITKKALENFGFPAAAILADWASIAGGELASYTAPERLRWPNRRDLAADSDESSAHDSATLVLRVEGPRALEVQHCIGQLIERINAHFGFRAVTDIRILQAPVAKKRPRIKSNSDKPPARRPIPVGEIPNDQLREALEKLGGQVRRAHAPKES